MNRLAIAVSFCRLIARRLIARRVIASVLIVCLLPASMVPALADDWMRWRGPLGSGVSLDADPPVEWSRDRHVRWSVEIPGRGSSTPIVFGDHVFLLTAIKTDRMVETKPLVKGELNLQFGTRPQPTNVFQFAVICFDRTDGSERWRRVAAEAVPHESGHLTNSYASSSPVTDGRRLFVNFGSRGVYAFDLQGNVLWQKLLGEMETRRDFGEASSPALHGDSLVIPWDHEGQSYLYCLDARTGGIRWQVERSEPTTWSTPLIIEHQGTMQVVTNGTTVRSYDLKTGQLIWSCGGQASNPIAVPMASEGLVYCMTGYRGYSIYAISLGAEGDADRGGQVAWHRHDAAPYVSSALLYEGRLYFTKSRSGVLSVLDMESGHPLVDQFRLPELRTIYASPVGAAGRVYFSSREGTTVVLAADSKSEPTVLAVNQLGEAIDASPALVGREMFIRTATRLYCLATDKTELDEDAVNGQR